MYMGYSVRTRSYLEKRISNELLFQTQCLRKYHSAKENNKGPRTVPCGTPDMIQSDLIAFTTTLCCLKHRKVSIYFIVFFSNSIAKRFFLVITHAQDLVVDEKTFSTKPVFNIGDREIKCEETVELLRVEIDSRLKFDGHI